VVRLFLQDDVLGRGVSAVGLVEDLVKLLRDEFPELVITEPRSETDLHALIFLYLKMKGYVVNYTGGRAQPDFIVTTKRSKTEVPIEVKVASTAKLVDDGFKQLFNYMKGTKWRKGILYIWDRSKKAVAYSRAKELGKQSKYGRTIITIGIKR